MTTVTPPMRRKAETLAVRVPTMSKGRSKRDGTPFVIVPGSTPATAHWATAQGCTCVGFRRRNVCTHQLAVKIAQTPAAAPQLVRKMTYSALMDRFLGED